MEATTSALSTWEQQTELERVIAKNQDLEQQIENIANLWQQERTNKEQLQQKILENQNERSEFASRVESNIKLSDEQIAQLKVQVIELQKQLQETKSLLANEKKQNEENAGALKKQINKLGAKLKVHERFFSSAKENVFEFIRFYTTQSIRNQREGDFSESVVRELYIKEVCPPIDKFMSVADNVPKELLNVDRQYR